MQAGCKVQGTRYGVQGKAYKCTLVYLNVQGIIHVARVAGMHAVELGGETALE